jgi:hypothetical protein
MVGEAGKTAKYLKPTSDREFSHHPIINFLGFSNT